MSLSAPAATVRPVMAEEAPAAASGPFAADGTLRAPRTGQPSPAPLEMRLYSVVHGDTLTGIAAHFGLSMMTIWWANTLTSKDQLHVGQVLRIPPVDGVLYTAQEGDTVAAVAARFHADPAAVTTYNGLATDELTLGQQVMIPNGVGSSIALAAAAHPTVATDRQGRRGQARPVAPAAGSRRSPGPCRVGTSARAFGCTGFPYEPAFGNCAHYHFGIDIAAPNGTSVLAAAAGTVTFAGWRDNDGGYQVTISDGHDYYTGYYHLSALLVHAGQHVGRGQLIAPRRLDRPLHRAPSPLRGVDRAHPGRRHGGQPAELLLRRLRARPRARGRCRGRSRDRVAPPRGRPPRQGRRGAPGPPWRRAAHRRGSPRSGRSRSAAARPGRSAAPTHPAVQPPDRWLARCSFRRRSTRPRARVADRSERCSHPYDTP